MSIATLAQLPVRDACEEWLESRKHHICPRTFIDYSNYIKTVSPFFSRLLITDLDGDHLRRYQHERSLSAGPETINKELGVIIQVRKRINRPIEDYQRLQQRKDYESPGRRLTPAEEAVLTRVCKASADHETWDVAALCILLAMRTGMTQWEILNVKLKDITLGDVSTIFVDRRGAKRVSRERSVVIVGDAEWAAHKLIERCQNKCGGFLPDHYLIPGMNRDHSYDPTRHATSYRSGIEHLFAIAEIEARPNDMRHHSMSKALSSPRCSLAAVRDQYGHVSNKMQKRYYHGNLQNQKIVAEAAAAKEEVGWSKKPVQKQASTGRSDSKYLKWQAVTNV